THDADGNGSIESGGSALAADVAECDAQLLRAVAQEFVEVAANFACREVTSGNVKAVIAGGHGTKQRALDALGGLEVALEAGFVFGNLLVEACVFQRDGEIRGEDGKGLNVFLGKVVELRTFQIEDADDFALVQHGNRELRAGLGIHEEVAFVGGDVGNEHRFTQGCGSANDAFAGGDPQLSLDPLAVLDVEPVAKNFLLFVVEHDADNLIVDDALDEFGGAAKEFFNIEDGANLAADFREDHEGFALGALFLEKARILNGDGKATGQKRENVLLVFGEVVRLAALDIEDTNASAAEHERDSQFRADSVNGVDVAGILSDVADTNRVPGSGSGAGNALPDRNSKVLG